MIKKDQFGEFLISNIKSFINSLNSLDKTQICIPIMHGIYVSEINKVRQFINKKGKNISKKDGIITFILNANDGNIYQKIKEERDTTKTAVKIFPGSLLVSMVSQFDIFVASVIKEIVNKYPKIILSSDKKLEYKDLAKFRTKKEINDYLIEKETDAILYGNHISQLEWLNTNLGINFENFFPNEIAEFIELTERRNLFVHSNGLVNTRYLDTCKKYKSVLDCKYKKGDQLKVTPEYLKNSYTCLYKISTMITYILWKKIISENKDQAEQLNVFINNDLCINLIKNKKYSLAKELLYFCLNYFSESTNDIFLKIFTINIALSEKLLGNNKIAIEFINKSDWSSSANSLKLAVAIIKDDFNHAFELIKKIGSGDEIIDSKNSYKSDPLFYSIRKLKEFRGLYKEIFNEDYLSMEEEEKKLFEKDLQKNIKKSKKVNFSLAKRPKKR